MDWLPGSVMCRGFTLNTVFVALAPKQNCSDSTCRVFKTFYVMKKISNIKEIFLLMASGGKNIFHHKSYKQEVLI